MELEKLLSDCRYGRYRTRTCDPPFLPIACLAVQIAQAVLS